MHLHLCFCQWWIKSHSLYSQLVEQLFTECSCTLPLTGWVQTVNKRTVPLLLPCASSPNQNSNHRAALRHRSACWYRGKTSQQRKKSHSNIFLPDQWIDPIHCTAAQPLRKINQNLKLPTDAAATLILMWLSTASSKSAVSCSAQKAWQMGEVCGRQSVCQKRWHVCLVVNSIPYFYVTCTSDLFENTLLITSRYKGAKVTHRLLVLTSQKNYHREQSFRVKDLLEGTGSMPENASSDS